MAKRLAGEKRSNEEMKHLVSERTAERRHANLAIQARNAERIRLQEDREKLLRDFARGREEERNRIARDLHDSLGQHLTALTLGIKAIERSEGCPEEIRASLRRLGECARLVDEEIDRISHALLPMAVAHLGLPQALAHHLEAWTAQTGITVVPRISRLGSRRFPVDVETTIYRIVQEALTNVHKHAGAKNVSLIAEVTREELRIIIRDDGAGFDVYALADDHKRMLGLRGMRERVALLDGDIQIESARGRGTTLYLSLPLGADLLGNAPLEPT
jgi:signal transduction histidine kinase